MKTTGVNKRTKLSFVQKLDIINKLSSNPPQPRNIIAKDFNIDFSTISKILKNKEAILKQSSSVIKPDITFRIRPTIYPELDEAMIIWFRQIRSSNPEIAIDGRMLLEKTQYFANQFHYKNPSERNWDSWIERWRMRYNITSKKIVGESLSADKDSAAKWIDFTLPTIINQYGENNIFNADELGLFYNQSAKQTFTEGSCSVSGIKQSKDRVSVLLAASMTGEKLCPLVIGKSKSPRCLKGKFLPTLYNHSKKSWMNAVIFNDYVKRLNEKMSISHRKIALIVDNCAAHSADSVNLSHVSLFYLPPNVTSIIQPMDAGIIKVFKHFYKCLFLRKKLAKVECGVATKITILEVLNMVEKAWKKVKKETIENCFKHAEWDPAKEKEKVIVNIEEDEMNEYNVLFEKLKTRDSDLFEITAEEFYQAEDHEITREILSEEEIVDSIISKSNVSEDEITEKVKVDEEGRKRKVKTIGEANKMWNMLKEFIEDKSPPKDSHKVINEVEDLLEKVAINNLIQPSLTDFNMFGTTDERDSHENTVGIKGDAGKEKKVKV